MVDETAAVAGSNLDRAAAAIGIGNGKEAEAVLPESNAGDGVTAMMGRLKLTPREAKTFVLNAADEEAIGCPEWALVGKVLAPNTLHVNTISAIVKPAWGNPRGLMVRPCGKNLFLAEFESKADMQRVINGSPWVVSKNAILLRVFDPRIRPADTVFDRLLLWVRIYGLPFSLMNSERGGALAGMIGKVEKVEVDERGRAWGDYLRVRINVDITEPFMRDENGLLPWNSDMLCVPEVKWRDQRSSSGQGAQSGQGSSSQPSGKEKKDAEVSSPVKARKPRARKPTQMAKGQNATTEGGKAADHYAIVISLKNYQDDSASRPVQMGFKYEAPWLRSPDYTQVLQQAWNDDPDRVASLQGTWTTLHRVATSLAQWSKDTFGSVRKKIQKLERRLKCLRLAPWDSTDTEAKGIERELCELFEREEVMARQRSRIEWLKEGDRNTAFFHARASARRRTNKIKALVHEDGSSCTNIAEIKGKVEDFYDALFSSEPCSGTEAVLEAIPEKVTMEMNGELCKPYSDEEIRTALFQMGPTKAPGPDGFPALFYQTHWEFFKAEICNAVRGFLEGDSIPEGLCDSIIILIPKIGDFSITESLDSV
ncbi:hypothetical protein ACQ4PT_027916 [Festuca glaucescens]